MQIHTTWPCFIFDSNINTIVHINLETMVQMHTFEVIDIYEFNTEHRQIKGEL